MRIQELQLTRRWTSPLRLLPAPTVGLFLLGEPVGASILAYFLFGEVPGTWTLVGGAIVGALALVLTRQGPGETAAQSPADSA